MEVGGGEGHSWDFQLVCVIYHFVIQESGWQRETPHGWMDGWMD